VYFVQAKVPAGTVTVVRQGTPFKQVFLTPSGLQSGTEEVLVVIEGVHQPIPEPQIAASEIHIQPSAPASAPAPVQPGAQAGAQPAQPAAAGTDADRLRQRYQRIGEAQGHTFGEGLPGSKPPNFNLDPDAVRPAQPPASAAKPPVTGGAQPAAAAPKPPQTGVSKPLTAVPNPLRTGAAKPAAGAAKPNPAGGAPPAKPAPAPAGQAQQP
jgi:hypothetical protein